MQIGQVEIEGYRSWGDKQVVDLSRPGLVLLTGENQDRGKSSGAGKSTLFKAITTALFEENDDGSVKKNGVNTLQPEKGCRISVQFTSDDGVPHCVVYAYGHPQAGTDWYVYRWNGKVWLDLREERKGDTKEVIRGIINMDYGQFVNRALMAQETVAEFIWRTHKERLEIFSGIMNLSPIDRWVQSARDWRRDTEKELTAGKGKVELLTSQAERLKAALKPESTLQAYREAVATCDTQLRESEERLTGLREAAESISELMTLKGSIAALTEEKRKIDAEKRRLKQPLSKDNIHLPTETDVVRVKGEVDDLGLRHREAWVHMETAKKRLDAVRKKGDKCDSCEQPITARTLAALVERCELTIRSYETKVESLRESRDTAQADFNKLKSEYDTIKGQEKELERVIARGRAVKEQLEAAEASIGELREYLGDAVDHPDQLNEEFRQLSDRQVAITREKAGVEAALNAARIAVEQHRGVAIDCERQESENLVLEERIVKLKKIEASLGDKGFKSYKINASRTTFNNSLNRYLSMLSDGEIEAELVTETMKADGKGTKADLDIIVRDGEKAGVPIRQYSGGEKASLSLAITGSFWDLASSQAGGRVNVLLLDEPFANMDVWQEEKTCKLLESMRDSGRIILVVTNRQSVRDRGTFDREIRAIKSKHVTTIQEFDLSGDH